MPQLQATNSLRRARAPYERYDSTLYFISFPSNIFAVELLDPRWKEQKQRADARFATTNLSTADVANNLKRLASQRSDVFDGVTGQPISDEEAARRKRAAMSYDGTMESKEAKHMQSLNIEEQIRLIHQRAGQSK